MTFPFGLGRIPSETDSRDFLVSRFFAVAALPTVYESPVKTAILNQGTTPRCVTYSGATGRTVTEAPEAGGLVAFDPNDLWNFCHGGPQGTQIRIAAAVLLKTGALATSGPTTFKGERFKIGAYAGANDLDSIKQTVFVRGWAWLGVDWRVSWQNPLPSGMLHGLGPIAGGHAISVRGWSDVRGALHIQNSWGTRWGVGGWCWLPYGYLDSRPEGWATVDAPDCVLSITAFPARVWHIRKGQVLRGWNPKLPNVPLGPAYAWPKNSWAHCDAEVVVTWPGISPVPMPNGTFLRCSDGAYKGLLIRKSEVTM